MKNVQIYKLKNVQIYKFSADILDKDVTFIYQFWLFKEYNWNNLSLRLCYS